MLKDSKPILVVAGDSKSVFLEIFFKSYKKSRRNLILIVNKDILIHNIKILNMKLQINEISNKGIYTKNFKKKFINFINVPYSKKKEKKYIENCFDMALRFIQKDKKIGLINGPINKKNFLANKFNGITEYLASKTKCLNKEVMLIYNKNLSVSPLTTHIPVKKIHSNISKTKIINHVKKINDFYIKTHKKKPKIAITGLNPHCESNFQNSEEEKIIIPAIKDLIKKKYSVFGPFPADTIFLRKNYKKFDSIIGMYHDQVLAPIKSIYNFNAINITLGLPFLRVSPDHGPNIKMFGKNISDPNSLLEALKFLNR